MGPHNEFLTLFLEHQVGVRAFIGSLVRDRHTRDDLFQEVALTLWHEFARYDRTALRRLGPGRRRQQGAAALAKGQSPAHPLRPPRPSRPSSTLTTAVMQHRSRPFRKRAAFPGRPKPSSIVWNSCPEKSRRLLTLRDQCSLKLGEIAEHLHSTLDAVHKALSRIRERLAECIDAACAAQKGG